MRDWVLGTLLTFSAYFAQNAYQDIRGDIVVIREKQATLRGQILDRWILTDKAIEDMNNQMMKAVYVGDTLLVIRMPPILESRVIRLPLHKEK